jgi:GNAT superfamily N-acetyltransferase
MQIRPLLLQDRPAWQTLWNGYIHFYQAHVSPSQTDLTWQRLLDASHPLQGFVAQENEHVIGLAHCFIHSSTWSDAGYCYLEDLFVDPAYRGRGAARQLIEHTGAWAALQGVAKLYWLTQENNLTGQLLYNKVGKKSGFIHYERALG